MFLCFLSSDEDRIDKSPNLFGCDFQCIQERAGLSVSALDIFLFRFIPLLPMDADFSARCQFLFQSLFSALAKCIDGIAFECAHSSGVSVILFPNVAFLPIASISCTVSAMVFAALVSFCRASSFFFCFPWQLWHPPNSVLPVPPVRSQLPNAAVLPAP